MTQRHAVITDEMLERERARLGIEHPYPRQYNHEVTRDSVLHYVEGIGDMNPLYINEEYANNSMYGGIIAPPCWFYSCGRSGGRRGLPGIHSLWAGDDWEWYRPARLGDQITAYAKAAKLDEKKGRFAGRMFLQVGETTYRNQKGEIVARSWSNGMRFERGGGEERSKYENIKLYRYSEEELKAIDEAYQRVEMRGANPRYWEDVQIGEEISPIVKGPMTITEMIAWLMGIGSDMVRASDYAWAYARRHPKAWVRDRETNVPDSPGRVHWEFPLAKEIGLPAPYDIGGQRHCWLSQLMTNWIGDYGWLRRLSVRLRHPNFVADTAWCKGKVADKYVKDGEYIVECDVWSENQRGVITAPARATVILPSRAGGKVTFPIKGAP